MNEASMQNKILIVDDDIGICRTLEMILEKTGYEVDTTTNGKDALRKFKTSRYPIALIDLRLPDIDGILLLSEMSEHSPGTEIFLITGHASFESAVEAVNLGAAGYITKPLDIEEVLKTIQDAVLKQTLRFEKEEALKALAESEEKFRQLAEQMQESVWMCDIEENDLIYVNPTFEAVYDFNRHSLKESNKKWIDFIHSDDRKKAEKMIGQALKVFRQKAELYRIIRPDGSIKWISSRISVIKDIENKPTAYVGLDIDVTEKRQMEIALKESEIWFRSIFRKSPISIIVFDVEGQVVAANISSLRLFGLEDSNDFHNMSLQRDFGIEESQLSALKENDEYTMTRTIDFDKVRANKLYPTQRNDIVHLEFAISRLSGPDTRSEGYLFQIIDVTEKERAKNKMLEEKEKVELYLDLAGAIIIALNRDGKITLLNKFGCELIGVEESDVLGKSWFKNFIPKEDRESVSDYFINLLKGQDNSDDIFENNICTLDGSKRLIRWKNTILYGENHETIGTVSYGQDITEVNEALHALKESEDRFHRVFSQSPLGIIILDTRGNIVSMNQAMKEMLRMSSDSDSIGTNLFQNPNFSHLKNSFMSNDIPPDLEVKYDYSIGEPSEESIDTSQTGFASLKITASSMGKDEHGESQGIFLLVQDITESNRLRQRQQYLAEILENVSDAVISTDKKLNVKSWNSAAERIYGITEAEAMGKSIFEIIPTEYLENQISDPLKDLYISGRWSGEVRQYSKHGNPLFIQSLVSTIEDGTEIQSIIFVNRDVTTQVQNKRELKAERDRAMLYLDLMGHDIRNKLQAVMMGYDIIEYFADENEMIRDMIEHIQSAATACTDLISKVKKTEKLTAVPLFTRDLNEVLINVTEDFSRKHPDVDIKLNHLDAKALVTADEFLEDLILTFLENAVHHNPRERKRLWVTLENAGSKYRFTVSDNGTGISDSRKQWLFDKERRFGGVGLHQAKQIIEKYVCSIDVNDRINNEPDIGAQFTIWFPSKEG